MNRNRRTFIRRTAALASIAPLPAGAQSPGGQSEELIRKPIPSTAEAVVAIGVGTARRYEGAVGEAELAPLRETLRTFLDLGGDVVDTAPSYGDAETVVGGLLAALGHRKGVFLATKVGAAGRSAGSAQIERSFDLLQRKRLDLIAVHNLQDVDTQVPLLHELKKAGRVRHVGATTSSDRQYAAFEAMMNRQTLDFIQVDFALDNRGAAERLLPLARERHMAVMINLPFGRGRLFSATKGKPLPPWAAEFDCTTWAQFFLKYIIAHDAVTCAIPGMARPEYVLDNMGAARGRLPDATARKRMEAFIDAL